MIPMTSREGKIRGFKLPLMRHNKGNPDSHSLHNSIEKYRQHYEEYRVLCNEAISALPSDVADQSRKEKLYCMAEYLKWRAIFIRCRQYDDEMFGSEKDQVRDRLVESARVLLNSGSEYSVEDVRGKESYLTRAVRNKLISKPLYGVDVQLGRVVGFGEKAALRKLSKLKHSPLYPTEFWDLADDEITAYHAKLSTLMENDCLLWLPSEEKAVEASGLTDGLLCKVLHDSDIREWIRDWTAYKSFLAVR